MGQNINGRAIEDTNKKKEELREKANAKKRMRANLYFFRTLCDISWKRLSFDDGDFYNNVVFVKALRFNKMLHPSSNSNVLPEEIGKANKETGISKGFFQGEYLIDIGITEDEWVQFFKDRENKSMVDKNITQKYAITISDFKKKLRKICCELLEKDVESTIDTDMKCIIHYAKFKKAYNTSSKYEWLITVIETIKANDLKQFDDKLLEEYEIVLGKKYELVKAFNIVKKN